MQVDVHQPQVGRDLDVAERAEWTADAGVVEGEVQRAEAVDGGVDGGLDVFRLRDVAGNRDGAATGGEDRVDDGLGGVELQVAGDDVGALGSESEGDGFADS